MERQRHMAGATLRLNRAQWEDLSERMRGEEAGGWIMSSQYQNHGGTYTPCVAITTDPGDARTLTIWLTHIIEVSGANDYDTALEDLRYLANQVRLFRPRGFTYPTYYLPCVIVEKGVTDDSE